MAHIPNVLSARGERGLRAGGKQCTPDLPLGWQNQARNWSEVPRPEARTS